METRLTRIIMYCCIALLTMSEKCVVIIKDKKAREKQVKNAGNTLGEFALSKKILKTKEAIDNVYKGIYALQDSIDKAKYDVRTVIDLKMSHIEEEMSDLSDLRNDLIYYMVELPDNPYSIAIQGIYQNQDGYTGAEKLTNIIYYTDADGTMPGDINHFTRLVAGRNNIQFYFNEFVSKRGLQAAHIYRKWARIYREKGAELSQRVLTDNAFTMTDYERIIINRLAQKYIVLSYEFMEKSDSLTLAVGENQDRIRKKREREMTVYLMNQKIFEGL